MIDSLYIGATGMQAQQMNIDVIANNLANVNTTGFKRNRVDFEDLVYRSLAATRGTIDQTAQAAAQIGVGTSVAGSGKIFSVGDVKKTDQPFDLAVQGQGFFEVVMPDGTSAYTRNGAFRLRADGLLETQDGHTLSSKVQVPPDATSVKIESDGRVTAAIPNEQQPTDIGRLDLVSFVNPSGLSPIGENLYVTTPSSGDPLFGTPGQNGLGTLAQGFLEASNVRLIDELVGLIVAQRAYETNAKVVQASDEMMSISNGLFR
jgi:flagellar basal-body rod protein FlgG